MHIFIESCRSMLHECINIILCVIQKVGRKRERRKEESGEEGKVRKRCLQSASATREEDP